MKWKLNIRNEIKVATALVGISFLIAFGERKQGGSVCSNLIVNVELRRPMARIVQQDAPDAYIADDGVIMPVSEKYTSRVMLLSGAMMKKLLESEDLNRTDEGRQILEMIRYINEERFWKAQ